MSESARPHLSSRLIKAGPLALAMAVGGAVAAFAAPTGAPAAAAAVVTCTLDLPAQPLTAQGLATPFELSGFDGQACHEADAGTAAFVQGLVLDPATGQLSVYDPLVIDAGTRPAVDPAVPTLPANAVVALWFGFNGGVLTLRGDGVAAGNCVNGLQDSPFGQFSYCNAPNLFSAAHTAMAGGKLTVPPLGTATDGKACPTTRDFGIVDQDQSDNVTTTYLALGNGHTAQNTQAAAKALAGRAPVVLANGSDNLLLDHFVDPALGCVPWTVPDLANNGIATTSLGLNELQAAADQAAPVAVVPLNDPMVLDANGATDDNKTDLYRAGVDQPPLAQVPGSPTDYCSNLRTLGVQRTKLDRTLTDTTVSPDTGAASNLFTFLAMRLQQSYVNLGCQQLLQQRNPVHLRMDGAGLVVDAVFDTVGTGGSASPSASASTSTVASASASPSASATTSPSASLIAGTSPSASVAASTSQAPPPVTVTTPPAPATSAVAPPPASTPAAVVTTPPAASTGSGNSTNAAGTSASPAASVSASMVAPQQSTHPATGTTSPAAAAGAGGTSGNGKAGGSAAKQPVTPASTTAINVVGFEHNYTAAGSNNPNSALAGPDPMTGSAGFSIMNSRVFWALGGALLVLCLSLGYQRRPKQRKRSRRGVSS